MAVQILMPKQGNSVESCIILDWKKQEGETIALGEVLCEVETDKATIEVESTAEGTILKLLYEVDDDVPVQVPIAIVGDAGEDISHLMTQSSDDGPEQTAPVQKVEEPVVKADPAAAAPAADPGSRAVSPRARMTASQKGVDPSALQGTGPKGRVIERDVISAAAGRQPLSPAAKARMMTEGLTAPSSGSGIGGRILSTDLAAAGTQRLSAAADTLGFPGPVREIPVRSIRKITAKRMYGSLATTAQLTLHAAADATQLKALRSRLKASDPELGLQRITITDLVLYAVAKTLKDFPSVNSHFLGDRIVEFEHVHLGCAVDAPKGLMVPVVKFADLMSLKALSDETKRLVGDCLDGKITPEDLEGGTFTVTNLGAMGIDSFTPVLNVPESAILGVCTIRQRPVETSEGVTFVPHIGLSLTFDHQSIDGAPAARFLKALTENIKNIDLLMAR